MKLITYATHNSGYFEALQNSSSKNGFELITLGYNTEWKGLNQKFIDIKKYLKNYSNQNEIVCFVDGFDCIVLGSSNEMLEKYKSRNTEKVLFAADKDSYISTQMYGPVNKINNEKTYNRINTGCYIGKVKSILELLTNLCDYMECKNDSNDQTLMTLFYNKCRDCLDIDYDRNIFYNLELDIHTLYWQFLLATNSYSSHKAPLENKYYKLINKRVLLENGNYPIILHGNGDTNMDLIVEQLGYPISIKHNKKYYDYTIKPYFYKIIQQNPIISYILYYFIAIFHIIIMLFIYVYVYFTNNLLHLSIIIFLWVIIIIQWFLIGNCFCSNIENLLSNNNKKLENGKEPSFLLTPLNYLLGETIAYYITTLYPIVVIFVALYKINKVKCYNKRK